MDAGIKNNNDNFNTSHVNVNQGLQWLPWSQENISIHLMLMLIDYDGVRFATYYEFQYISC